MKYLLISLLILSLGFFGLLNPLRNSYLKIVSPIQFGLNSSAHDLKESAVFYKNLASIRDENISLKDKINSLETEVFESKKYKDENEVLRDQLKLKNLGEIDKTVIYASVMGNSEDTTGSTLYINAGTSEGVKKSNNIVLGNSIIGIVREVLDNKSLVELITSQNVTMTVIDLDSLNNTEGLAIGQFGTSIIVERILPTEELKVGDTIYTSGKDGFFLPGYLVGEVTEVKDDPSQPLKSAVVKTKVDFTNLTKVFVLTD